MKPKIPTIIIIRISESYTNLGLKLISYYLLSLVLNPKVWNGLCNDMVIWVICDNVIIVLSNDMVL